jgi:hypothetical protein
MENMRMLGKLQEKYPKSHFEDLVLDDRIILISILKN